VRLSKVRLAGFKSFVDPTTLDLRSNLTGILGPNGCGKSNTIDAVRWVMGESSARHLRGESMDDVIFNGSSARKPVGMASVELVFDNSDGQLGGEYARYAEIAIKRQISRDGASRYFLNGTRCRRRDITDIFLGTGLGPRSYAIIEQGMISRLVEAKPEELRNTLEEAAGISRYKERRRETETRIRHTRDNLERLTDLRDELGKQLQKLDRQAKAAKRYTVLKDEQRTLEAKLLLLQLDTLQQHGQALNRQLHEAGNQHQACLATVQAREQQLGQLREQQHEVNEHLNTLQGRYYQAGADISRAEQAIRHREETRQRQQSALARLDEQQAEAHRQTEEDRLQQQQYQAQLQKLEPALEQGREQVSLVEAQLAEAEQQQALQQEQWQAIQQRMTTPMRQAQLEKARMEALERQNRQLEQRLERLQQESRQLSGHALQTQAQALTLTLEQTRARLEDSEMTLDRVQEQLQSGQEQLQTLRTALDTRRSQQQALQGRLASLETLQQAGLRHDDQSRSRWLHEAGLAHNPTLAEQLDVETGWEMAVEQRLTLDALWLEQLDQLPQGDQAGWPDSGLAAVEYPPHAPTGADLDTGSTFRQPADERGFTPLAGKVLTPLSIRPHLHGVYVASSLEQALHERRQLQAGECFITAQGVRIGPDWLHVPGQGAGQGSILQRQQEIRRLKGELEVLEQALEHSRQATEQQQQQTRTLEQQRQQLQPEVNRLHREESAQRSELAGLTQKLEQLEQRGWQLARDQEEIRQQLTQQHTEHEEATLARNAALEQLEQLEAGRGQQEQVREQVRQQLADLRATLRRHQDTTHALALELETTRTRLNNSAQQQVRLQSRLEQLQQQRTELEGQITAQEQPEDRLEEALQQAQEQHAEMERQLQDARQQVQALEQHIRESGQERVREEKQTAEARDRLEQLKLERQSVQVREQGVAEQFGQTGFDHTALLAQITATETPAWLQQRLQEIQDGIQRLGPINLAAIGEFREQSERQQYLDQQNEDLVVALNTLESAIEKIDRETRTRFRNTFEHVNRRLGEMFPRLFGGGQCHLEMTENDILTTGITLMARPPGKRLSRIHLMSGGEKALTAVALVFAIFELNPAPFCLLDEVDAPLDEANVGRFCELVRTMSERVQFIFITHNKTTMELAENLIGVTMREPGVSRLVAVDVAEAVRLANA